MANAPSSSGASGGASAYNASSKFAGASGSWEFGDPARQEVRLAGVVDTPTDTDTLGFAPYVAAVATFLKSPRTQPPFTISVEGSWGSGKSSFLKQLKRELGADARVIEFNAWQQDKQEALWAAFALEFVQQLEKSTSCVPRQLARLALLRKRFSWRRATPRLLQAALLFAALAIALVIAVRALREAGGVDALIRDVAPDKEETVLGNVLRRLTAGGSVIGILAVAGVFVQKVAEIVGNPLKLELRKYLSEPDYKGQVAFASEFHRDFALIVDAYAEDQRVYVFIDDLDRCEVPKAADLVQAMHVLMASESKQLIFVLAIDRDIVAAALASKYESLIPYLAAMRTVDDAALTDAQRTARIGLDYGHDFLEKLIQLPFRVPQPAPANVGSLLDSLEFAKEEDRVRFDAPSSEVPRQLIEVVDGSDSNRMRDIVATLAPALDYNPRRIKQFVGMLRLQAYIAGATGLIAEDDQPEEDTSKRTLLTLEQLGKFVALSLRWPRLVADIEQRRDLLRSLQLFAWNVAGAKDSLVVRWANDPEILPFFRLAAPSPAVAPDDAPQRYRLDTVDVELLLRVSPPRVVSAASPSSEAPPRMA
jgi:hypothetical protein